LSDRTRRVGGLLAAAFLASIMATTMVVPTLALTTSNANPSVTVPTGTPTSIGISYAWSGTAPADTLAIGTTFAVNIPGGYAWSAAPAFTSAPVGAITFTGPVATNGGLTQTWTLATFPASGSWTLTFAGGTITTSSTSGTAPVTLTVGATAPVQIAGLTASGAAAGSLVPVLVSPTTVPARGTSTIRIAFGVVGATCATHTSFTVGSTAGVFTATTLTGVTIPAGGSTSVTVACANFGTVNGTTLTLKAPAAAGSGTISVVLSPLVGGSFTDSSTSVTFTTPAGTGGSNGGRDQDRGNGHGARKTGFYAAGLTAAGCATAVSVPAAGATSFGFAVLTTTGHGKLNVTVALKGAVPNATFSVSVSQGGTCSTPFTIRTNRAGNGASHQHLSLVAGAKTFWVTATTGSVTYVTKAVTLATKGTRNGNGNGRENGREKGKANRDH
jgi:hypothetical protein